jgi:sodium pump decarboxylase gamma subunit
MNQWFITALGMGTVFLALIVLSLILSGFPLVFRRAGKERPARVPLPALSSRRVLAEGSSSPELVAVITAAVCAASGMRPGDFRIAGISPAEDEGRSGGFNTPIWGHVDRLCRRNWQR